MSSESLLRHRAWLLCAMHGQSLSFMHGRVACLPLLTCNPDRVSFMSQVVRSRLGFFCLEYILIGCAPTGEASSRFKITTFTEMMWPCWLLSSPISSGPITDADHVSWRRDVFENRVRMAPESVCFFRKETKTKPSLIFVFTGKKGPSAKHCWGQQCLGLQLCSTTLETRGVCACPYLVAQWPPSVPPFIVWLHFRSFPALC